MTDARWKPLVLTIVIIALLVALPNLNFGLESIARVSITDSGYVPDEVTIPVNGTVIWRNVGQLWHTVTSVDGLFDSGILDPLGGTESPWTYGQHWRWTFNASGSYEYYCKRHPHPFRERGVVIVLDSEPTPTPSPSSTPTNTPTPTPTGTPSPTVNPNTTTTTTTTIPQTPTPTSTPTPTPTATSSPTPTPTPVETTTTTVPIPMGPAGILVTCAILSAFTRARRDRHQTPRQP